MFSMIQRRVTREWSFIYFSSPPSILTQGTKMNDKIIKIQLINKMLTTSTPLPPKKAKRLQLPSDPPDVLNDIDEDGVQDSYTIHHRGRREISIHTSFFIKL